MLQLQLQQPRLKVASVKHRKIAPLGFFLDAPSEHLAGHSLGFGLLMAVHHHANRRAVTHLRPQGFVVDVGVVGNQRVGGAQYRAGRAVVLLQLDDFQAREILPQGDQVFRPCAPPGVNRLVVVADHGKGGAFGHQQLYQQVLGDVGVLVLIHQHIVDFSPPAGQRFRVTLQEHHGQQNQVVEIHRVVGFQVANVGFVHPCREMLVVIGSERKRIPGQHQVVFPLGYLGLHGVDLLGIDLSVFIHQVPQQRLGVFRVEQRKPRLVAQGL